ncbi:hypothetical protein JCM10908_006442 [Rhodotorula pacifica]|uniref:uncharacterized protein n=1 Tax=Rhodotorula pacifica TaxID=1495444 RepID=UPI003179A7E7
MRSFTLTSFALSSLALLVAASPEPCSDHPGVIHKPGEYTVPEVQKLVDPKPKKSSSGKKKHTSNKSSSSSSASSSSAGSSSSTTSQSNTVNAAPVAQSHDNASTEQTAPASGSSTSSGSTAPWTSKAQRVKTKPVPKVEGASAQTVAKGAAQAVGSFANSSYIPPAVAGALSGAISSVIQKQIGTPSATTMTITKTKPTVSTILASNATATATTITNSTAFTNGTAVANGTVTALLAPTPAPVYITVTRNITEIQVSTSTLITTSDAVAASLNIKEALDEAFAAANLSQSGLNATTTAALEKCLSEVLAAGGMPTGYSCLTPTGSDSAGLQATLNTILEQFVGILPNTILSSVFDAVTPLLGTLLPASEQALVTQIQSSIQSVIASLSGNSVTALEQVSQCYTDAIQQAGNTSSLACFTKPNGAYTTLQTAMNGVLEQFVGVLPASLTTSVENILSYNIQNATTPSAKLGAQVGAQISNAINSVASSLAGNTVTAAEILQSCAAELISTGNATAAQECVTKGTAPVTQTTILSIAQQYDGYLPSSFFTDLVDYSSTLLNTTANAHNLTQAELNSSLESFFNNQTSYGAAYVSCISQVEQCVTNAVTKSGTIDAVCPGPVKGCSLAKADSKRLTRRVRRDLDHSSHRHFGSGGRIRNVPFH